MLVKTIGVLAVAAVGGPTTGLNIANAIGVRAEHAQESFRVHRARTDFHVVGLLKYATLLHAKKTGLMGIVEGRLRTKWRAARNAAIEARQPAAQPHRPKDEVAQRQVPIAGALDFPRGQQDQPEHGLGDFVLRQNALRDLADHREPGAETVIA